MGVSWWELGELFSIQAVFLVSGRTERGKEAHLFLGNSEEGGMATTLSVKIYMRPKLLSSKGLSCGRQVCGPVSDITLEFPEVRSVGPGLYLPHHAEAS